VKGGRAFLIAEKKIEDARQSGATELSLSGEHDAGREVAPDAKLRELPESLRQLTHLQSLDLSNNQIESLPQWVADFGALNSLNLFKNGLSSLGPVTELKQLHWLNISGNELRLLPESIAQLENLETLELSNNNLEGLPRSLGKLNKLQTLNVSSNQIRTFPETFAEASQLSTIYISNNKLTDFPAGLDYLKLSLQNLHVDENRITELPDWLSEFAELSELDVGYNDLTTIPESFFKLKKLRDLNVRENPLRVVPPVLRHLKNLEILSLHDCELSSLPEWFGELRKLQFLGLGGNHLTDLPRSFGKLDQLITLFLGYEAGKSGNPIEALPKCLRYLKRLQELYAPKCQLVDLPPWLLDLKQLGTLNLKYNPLNPELAAAYEEGFDAIKRYLRAKAAGQVRLNEAKLILIGEGEVGKSCLLAALRDDPWVEGNPTTHGIEIKPVSIINPDSKEKITLNAWDFGGQRVYRPTHQLFFSTPAIYLVVWKPREGPQQGLVKEWISLVKHRAPDAKILVVATHGGPKQRQPDIDRQEIWDMFGRDMVLGFFFVDSRPVGESKKRKGINELKQAIARVAASLPEMGRLVPTLWEKTRKALHRSGGAYLSLDRAMNICRANGIEGDEAKDFIRVSNRLGHLIHYEHDPLLQDIVVLKPDWLSTAISFVLDDEQTRAAHGLISFSRLRQLWNDPKRSKDRYPAMLHAIFLRLMERYDLSYRVAEPKNGEAETSLIAQLVPDVRPDPSELTSVWPDVPLESDEQQSQICRIVDARNGQSATAEGLFFQLIVRLHKYSLGRQNYGDSVHWQRGLVLDDYYNGRALLEYIGNDIRITVRAAYPERFLSVLTNEVKWLVEYFWKGLRCEVTVPCMPPCGKGEPGTGLFEVEKLIAFKKQGVLQFPCFVSGCVQLQEIDRLLRNAPAVRRAPIEALLAGGFEDIRASLDRMRLQLVDQDREAQNRFQILGQNDRRIISQIEDAYTGLMQGLTDEAREGPRLFSFEPLDRHIFDRPKWISAKFRLTLWCEHSRLPLPAINGENSALGVYELDMPRDWVLRVAPYLRVLTGLLSLVVPVLASGAKLELDDATYKGLEKQLEFGQKSLESALKGGEAAETWAGEGDVLKLEHGGAFRAEGAALRQLHAWLKDKDPGFGNLVRVQNKRQEFLWVHPKFASEY
jgi:Leucine-rich repeat (LRR) protein/GTPase SAR1 family protein